jgi:hypothetical protein
MGDCKHMRTSLALALLLASASAGAAELYRWQDENGVVNYSNTPPPKTRSGKPATVVEDRLSVYTPERSVTDAIERRRTQPQPSASFTRPPEPERRVSAPPPPPPIAYDPCANPNDVNCPGYLYDGAPVFNARRRHVPLMQPHLPPGTIAGQSAGPNAYIPGQSGTAPPPPAPSRSPGAGFTLRDRDYPRR